jgi:hypothetical protein
MAISISTVSIGAGWARTDVIVGLETAFQTLGFHGSTQSGIVTGISSYSGGGTVGTASTDYYDVFPVSTSGIGTGASFYVDRNGGSIYKIYVNRPGVGYTNGEVVQLSAADVGGSANGATGIAITVFVAGGASPTGFGTTTGFYDKDVTAGGSYPWGVLRHQIQANKKYGSTYRVFQTISDTSLQLHVGSGFLPWNDTNLNDKGNGYPNRLVGNYKFDIPFTPVISSNFFDRTADRMGNNGQAYAQTYASSTSYALNINTFRSGIDPNFAVISFRQPTLSSTKLRDNTFFTFFLHNFTTSLWDLDYLFLGGFTQIIPSTSEGSPNLEFRTYINGEGVNGNNYYPSKRCAEFGYSGYQNDVYSTTYKSTNYYSNSYPQTSSSSGSTLYLRSNATTSSRNNGGYGDFDFLSSATNFNATIKGIPLNTTLIPVPYYLPDDFVLIDFDYAAPSANIQQGDTVTISGSEVYTVITGSYNQTDRTRGILFCARTI